VDPAAVWILRLSLALLLGQAALHKLRQPRVFAAILRDYRVLPDSWVGAVAPGIAAVEAALAAGLLLPPTAGVAALGGGGLLAVYAAAIGWNLARGRRSIDCGCLGPGARQPLSGWLVARNGLLVAACALAALPVEPRALGWLDAVTVAGGVGVLALLFPATNALAALAADRRRLGRTT